MSDYITAYETFSLQAAYSVLTGGGRQPVNAAIECCDRWCGQGRIALRWCAEDGRRSEYSFDELRDRIRTQLMRESGVRRFLQELRKRVYIDVRI